MANDVYARVSYGDFEVELAAEGASWNPDVVHDLIARIGSLWKESLTALQESGVLDPLILIEDDEDE